MLKITIKKENYRKKILIVGLEMQNDSKVKMKLIDKKLKQKMDLKVIILRMQIHRMKKSSLMLSISQIKMPLTKKLMALFLN
jgi:hypothetical protein